MIYAAKQLEGYHIHARDGVLGTVTDLYFDNQSWQARYFVVTTGSWLNGRQVLLAAARLVADRTALRQLSIDATQEQVRASPPIDSDPPVSRQQEQALHDHFGWPYYWGAAAFAGGALGPLPSETLSARDTGSAPETTGTAAAVQTAGDPHLCSVRTVRGYTIAALDGLLGHVEDLLFDDGDWTVRHLVIDTRNWLPGRKVVVPPLAVRSVDWTSGGVHLTLTREQIRQAPDYDPSTPLSAGYTDALQSHRRPRDSSPMPPSA